MTESTRHPLAPKELCTGCGACASGCPKNAIHLLPNREGFLYPTVTDACIQCGHCSHICPVLKQRQPRSEPAAFAVWNSDDATRRLSGAGGVFSVMAEFILDDGGVVCGAILDEKLHVCHSVITDKKDLHRLRGAKPVQSRMGESYRRVRYYLEQGRRVLFSGTPCQVDGLYRYLGEHPEKLLTCDILCTGVASPGVWEQLLHSMAYIKRQKPTAVTFCAKLDGEKDRRFRVEFEGGAIYDAPLPKSEFGYGLARRLFLRPACHTCPYTCSDRVGDLSLGTYPSLPKEFYPEEQKKGISLLLINSAKGAHFFDTLPLKKEKRPLSEAVAGNAALSTPIAPSPERTDFFDAFALQPFQQVRNRYLTPPALGVPAKRGISVLKKFFRKRNAEK